MSNVFTHGYALLVGVGESAYRKWSLPVTIRDAQALQAIVTDADLCAYPNNEEHVRLLHDAQATGRAILDGLAWLQAQAAADPEATILIYYSGHGWLDSTTGQYYLLPHDVEPFDVPSSALPAQAFAAAVGQITAERLLVFVDSCHAEGMATAKDAPTFTLPSGFVENPLPKGAVDALKQGAGRAVFTSSRGSQRSWVRPDGTLSIYTYHLIEALHGAGNQPGDTMVKLSDLMRHLSQAVPESARRLCQAEQTPFFDTATEDFSVALLRGGKGLPIGGWAAVEHEASEAIHRAIHVSGDRSVVVGRDAIDTTIVTGDGNVFGGDSVSQVVNAEGGSTVRDVVQQVFVGDYERLRDAYIEPWRVFERVDLDHFVGREWLLAKVDTFLEEHDRGYFVLEAEAGLGKTTFLAWLVRQRAYIHHFVELAPGIDGIGAGLKNLAAQLVLAYGLSAYTVEDVLPAAAARSDYLYRLLRQASERRQREEKVVLVVDALDEAGTPAGQNVLGLPQSLPEGVYVIASQRPVSVVLHVDTATTPRCPFPLSADSERNRDDMRRFLERAATWPSIAQALRDSGYTSQQFIAGLLEMSQGLWIYLHYVVHEIGQGRRSPLDLRTLPEGITQYYSRFWLSWRKLREDEWYETHLPILATLAAMQEATGAELLAAWATVEISPSRLCQLLDGDWRPFLFTSERNGQIRYRLYHASLREFLSGKGDLTELTEGERSFARHMERATLEAHARIASYYLADRTRWRAHEAYALKYLGIHLATGGDDRAICGLVKSEDWWNGKRQYDRSGQAYVRDVQLALKTARAVGREALRAWQKSHSAHSMDDALSRLPSLFALALAGGTVRGMGNSVPIEAIAGLARLGETELALNYAASIIDQDEWNAARQFAREFSDGTTAVLECSRQAEAYRRIGLACLDTADVYRCDGRADLCEEWMDQARLALRSATHILEALDGWDSRRGLQALVPAMVRAGLRTEAGRLTGEFAAEPGDGSGTIGVEVGNVLDVKLLADAGAGGQEKRDLILSLCRRIEDATGQEQAERAAREALDAVCTLQVGGWFGADLARELSRVASQIAGLGSNSMALELVRAVKELSFCYEDQRGRTLAGTVESLKGVLPERYVADLLEESWRIVCSNERRDYKAVGQARVVVAMHNAGMRKRAKELLAEAMQAIADIWPLSDRQFAIEALARAAALNGDLENLELGLSVSDAMEDRDWRGPMKGRIAVSFARLGAFCTAWEILDKTFTRREWMDIPGRQTFTRVIAEVEQTSSVDEALAFVEKLSGSEWEVQGLCSLVKARSRNRPDREIAALLSQVIETYLGPGMREAAEEHIALLEVVAESAARSGATEILAQLVEVAKRIENRYQRDQALTVLVPILLDKRVKFDDTALDLARRVGNSKMKVRVLATVAQQSHQAGNQRLAQSLLKQAAVLARTIGPPEDKMMAYVVTAKAMTACERRASASAVVSELIKVVSCSSSQPSPSLRAIRAVALEECIALVIDCIEEGDSEQSLTRLVSLVWDEPSLDRRVDLIADLAAGLTSAGRTETASQLMTRARQQLRNAVPERRSMVAEQSWKWSLADDSDYVHSVAGSMAKLQDSEGLLFLVPYARYLEDPVWQESYDDLTLLTFQAETLGRIAACLAEQGYMHDAQDLVEGLQTDVEREQAVYYTVQRLLLSPRRPEPIEWVGTLANKIDDQARRECAQRRWAWLAAHYEMESQSWAAARRAVRSAIQTLVGSYPCALFWCLSETVDALVALAGRRSLQAADFLYYSLSLVGDLDRYGAWGLVCALFPLVGAVAGRDIAEETWRQVQLIDDMMQPHRKRS